MKSYIAVAAIMAGVATASPVADGWANYGTTTTTEGAVYTTTTSAAAVYTTPATSAVYTTPATSAVYTTPAAVYTTPTTKAVYTTTTEECDEYSTPVSMPSGPVYTTPTTKAVYTTPAVWSDWNGVSSSFAETTTKKATATTSWAVWTTGSAKPTGYNSWNATSPIPKYTGAASQQGIAIGAMALAGVAMLL